MDPGRVPATLTPERAALQQDRFDPAPAQRRRALAGLLALPLATWATPLQAQGRTLAVARGERLDRAVAAAADGDTIELEAGDHHAQTALVLQHRLVLCCPAGRAVLHADGAHAEGKALIVVRQGDVRIEGLEFRGARVPDGNGAGIRFERGRLQLLRCRFIDNENGVLTSNLPGAELRIEECEFGLAPRHPGSLHHLLYVGRIARLRVERSRFSGGWRGHLLKSRAAHNEILCNHLADGDQGEASYEIDLPNAGQAWVLGNVIAQGPRPQNHALLAYGAEGPMHAESRLIVAHNHFVNESGAPAAFIRSWPARLPAGAAMRIEHNRFYGAADAQSWGRSEDGNRLLALGAWLRDPQAPDCTRAMTHSGS